MSPVREHLAQLVADEVDDGLEVELGGHALLDAVDHRQLGGALLGLLQQALRLVEQARVLERHAHARGDRLEQAHLGSAEGVLALVVLEVHRAEHAVAGEDRHDQHARSRGRCPAAPARRCASCSSARCRRPAAARLLIEPVRQRAGLEAVGRIGQAHAVLVGVEGVHQLRRLVAPADADVAGVEHLAQLVADEVDDRLEVELGGHPLLDAVDDRQLGVALLGFLQQPLRLVEQARVLERDAHAAGQRSASRRTSDSPKACSRS